VQSEVGEEGFGTERHKDNASTEVYRSQNMPCHNFNSVRLF
jgi:hypothetical protein